MHCLVPSPEIDRLREQFNNKYPADAQTANQFIALLEAFRTRYNNYDVPTNMAAVHNYLLQERKRDAAIDQAIQQQQQPVQSQPLYSKAIQSAEQEMQTIKQRAIADGTIDHRSQLSDEQRLDLLNQIIEAFKLAGIDVGNRQAMQEFFEKHPSFSAQLMTVFHGTGALFDHFDHSFMGTGEGAQAYGWGTYVTALRGLAHSYAKAVNNVVRHDTKRETVEANINGNRVVIDNFGNGHVIVDINPGKDKNNLSLTLGRGGNVDTVISMNTGESINYLNVNTFQYEVNDAASSTAISAIYSDNALSNVSMYPFDSTVRVAYNIEHQTLDIEDLKTSSIKSIRKSEIDKYTSLEAANNSGLFGELSAKGFELVKRVLEYEKQPVPNIIDNNLIDKIIERYNQMEIAKPNTTYVYDVEIPDDTGDNYLDWNEPIPEHLRERIANAVVTNESRTLGGIPIEFLLMDDKFGDFYKALCREMTPKEASLALSKAGFTGIKVPVNNLRGGNKNGDMNYIIFQENDAKITSTEVIQFLKTKLGEVAGFEYKGKLFVDETLLDFSAPIHEYTHLWDKMVSQLKPKLWRRGVQLMKQAKLKDGRTLWEVIANAEEYGKQWEKDGYCPKWCVCSIGLSKKKGLYLSRHSSTDTLEKIPISRSG